MLVGGAESSAPMTALRRMWDEVRAGRLPEEPTIEWYLHTTVDPSLQDPAGHHSSALFVQSVPYELAGTTWEAALPAYVEQLLAICERYAPGTGDLVADAVPLAPPGIEAHFGITGGHIHHIDNTVSFTDRMPYATGLEVLAEARRLPHRQQTPIIILTATGQDADRRQALELGATDFFTKPFSPKKLLARVDELFGAPPADGDDGGESPLR
jgi:CheY-like chemotaxis protein